MPGNSYTASRTNIFNAVFGIQCLERSLVLDADQDGFVVVQDVERCVKDAMNVCFKMLHLACGMALSSYYSGADGTFLGSWMKYWAARVGSKYRCYFV